MARIKDSSVEQVKAAADIVEIVSARTQLRKTGAGYMGRCPFHEERTPSFSVSAEKGTYHCFGCGVGGELAAEQGFTVRVVTLPPGLDPADVARDHETHLTRAESYIGYRVRLELERAPDRHEAFVRIRELLGRQEDSPEVQDALRYVADRLDLPKETLAGLA